MKKIVGVLAALSLALAMPWTAAAAEWKMSNGRWWYSLDGGRYPVNGWMWIDGDRDGIAECYYFDGAGLSTAKYPDPGSLPRERKRCLGRCERQSLYAQSCGHKSRRHKSGISDRSGAASCVAACQ